MEAGIAFDVRIDDLRVKVIYTAHFVNRYYERREGRAAPSERIAEDIIRQKLEEALPQIVDIAFGDPGAEGIIQSRKYGFAMTFAVKPSSRGLTIALKNIMAKAAYVARSMKDYRIEVNPPANVAFARGMSETLRDAVVDDLTRALGELEDESAYHLRGELVDYWVERQADTYYVDEADWLYDLYEIQVR